MKDLPLEALERQRGGRHRRNAGGVILRAFEWTHQYFPNRVDCRPISVAASLESAGFLVTRREYRMMWVPLEIVLALR